MNPDTRKYWEDTLATLIDSVGLKVLDREFNYLVDGVTKAHESCDCKAKRATKLLDNPNNCSECRGKGELICKGDVLIPCRFCAGKGVRDEEVSYDTTITDDLIKQLREAMYEAEDEYFAKQFERYAKDHGLLKVYNCSSCKDKGEDDMGHKCTPCSYRRK